MKLNENWLSNQRRALEEVRRLTERLEGSLRVAVRIDGVTISALVEAKQMTEAIEHEMQALRTRIMELET